MSNSHYNFEKHKNSFPFSKKSRYCKIKNYSPFDLTNNQENKTIDLANIYNIFNIRKVVIILPDYRSI